MKRPFSGPPPSPLQTVIKPKPFKIMSINLEDLIVNKEYILSDLIICQNINILLLQVTHCAETNRKPKIYELAIDRQHKKYGGAILVNHDIDVNKTTKTDADNIEILSIDTDECTVTSVHKPPNIVFNYPNVIQNTEIIIGDMLQMTRTVIS